MNSQFSGFRVACFRCRIRATETSPQSVRHFIQLVVWADRPVPSLRRMSRERKYLQWLAVQQPSNQGGAYARYKCKSIAALDIALGGLPAKMQVEADVGTGVSAK